MTPEQFEALRVWIQREAQMLDIVQHDLMRTGKATAIFEGKRKAAEDEARRLFVESVEVSGEVHYMGAAELVEPTGPGFRAPPIDEDQIAHMVNRFLGWRLPEAFRPDNGITFTPTQHQRGEYAQGHWPVGTNLLDSQQATEMVRYMVEGLPTR